MIAAMIAIVSGVLLKGRAVAAGIISMAVISRTPTTLIATATTTANDRVRIIFSRLGQMPHAQARSGLTVDMRRADQRQPTNIRTRAAPPQMMPRSRVLTERISPKR